MTRFFLGSVAALGIAGAAWAAFPALAQNPDRPRPEQRQRQDPAAMQRDAGLTEAQVGQLRQLRQADMKAEIRRHADLRIAHMELDELFEAATVDEKAVAAKTKVLADLEAAALKAKVDHRLAVRRIVSAEQYQKMKMAHPPRMEGGPEGAHRGRGPGGPGGPGGPEGMGGPGFGPPSGGPGGHPGAPPSGDDMDDLLGEATR